MKYMHSVTPQQCICTKTSESTRAGNRKKDPKMIDMTCNTNTDFKITQKTQHNEKWAHNRGPYLRSQH